MYVGHMRVVRLPPLPGSAPPSLLVFVVSCQFVLLAKTHLPILLPSASRWPIDGSEVLGVTSGENHAWGSGLTY